MPIFTNVPEEISQFYDLGWEDWDGWLQWFNTNIFGETPSPVLWDTKSGCAEKYQLVSLVVPEPQPT